MAEQKAQYFPASINLPKQLLNEVQELEKQIEQLIQAGQMKIQEKQELQGKKEQKDQKKILKQKLKQLGSIKYELATKLKSIDMQQRAIKAQKHRLQSQNHKNKMQKSVLTEQQKQRIVRVRKQQKQFQQKIKEKIEGIMSQIKQKQQQEQQEKRFKQDLKRKQRIVRMTEKKVKLAESRSKTLQILENSHLSIKKSEYVYMKNQEKDKKALKARQQQIEQVLREKKQKQRVDFEEIKEYAQQHDRIINQKKQQFLFEFKENQVRKRTKTLIYESQYGKRLKSEERRRELQKIKQINAKRQVRDRIQNFQSVISEKYKPKCTQDSAFVPKKQVEVLERLTFEQARQKGKEFLKIARKKAKKLTPHQSRIEVSSDKIGPSDYLPTSSSEKYPNYLVEFKSKNGQQSVLDRILKQKRVSSRKMQEVIRWMKKKQQGYNIGPHKSPSKSQFNSALQKIKLLNSMYQNETLQI